MLDAQRVKRRRELLAAIRGVIPDVLKKFPTISKIWLVGSIAKPIFFDMRSDVDLVVDGLPKARYFDLLAFLKLRLDADLDLILYSDVNGKDKAIFDKKVVLHEKTPLRGKTNAKK